MDFYTKMPAVTSFSDGLKKGAETVPDDWFVVMTDVVGSTIAIEAGKYKSVNIAGALPIISLARIYGNLKRPFVFGGDGMTFLVDPDHIDEAKTVLSRVLRDIKGVFDLGMRASAIPVQRLKKEGTEIHITKVQVSEQYTQAFLHGAGIQLAESILKDKSETAYHISPATDSKPVSYEGFVCRWSDIASPTGITAAIIVEPRGAQNPLPLLGEIEEILGGGTTYHPLCVETMEMGGSGSNWTIAYLLKTGGKKNLTYWLSKMVGWFEIQLTNLVMALDIPIRRSIYQVNKTREQNMANSDFRKYEGALKMIVSLNAQQLEKLREHLEKARKEGNIFYGIHTSAAAHMTCIATLQSGDDVHFIDATKGGYALAAKELKRQRAAV